MKPCLFLDRDGVIIRNVPYSRNPDDVELMPGIIQIMQTAQKAGYLLIVVTNQSGIGRGLLSEEDYLAITQRMLDLLAADGLKLDHIYYSPFYDKSQNPKYLQKPEWRKPAPGMILQACKDFAIDLKNSVMIGDRDTDMGAGFRGGVATRIMVPDGFSPQVIAAVEKTLFYKAI